MNFLQKIVEKLYLRINDNLVYFDSVTKCKTRFYYDTIAKPKYQKIECYVIFVDIDNLKYINDTRGHSYGTKVIKQVGDNLRNLYGIYDVCRIGGDEFVIFATSNFDINDLKHINHISYGYYRKEKYEDVSSAIKKADELMYNMKNIKKSR